MRKKYRLLRRISQNLDKPLRELAYFMDYIHSTRVVKIFLKKGYIVKQKKGRKVRYFITSDGLNYLNKKVKKQKGLNKLKN
jgi:predicted transcriptional regulator